MRWEKRTLGELVKSYGGKIQSGPFGSQLHQHDYKQEGIPVVMPKDIINDTIDTRSIARIGEEDASRLEKHKLEIGDLILPRRGDINKRAICKPGNEGWLCGTGCLKIRLNDDIIDPNYLYFYFNLPSVVDNILNRAVGSTMLNLSGTILSMTDLIYPPLPTQRRIAAILSAYDDLIENNLKRIKLLEEKAFLRYKEIVRGERLEEFLIEDVCQTLGGGTPSTGNEQYWNDGNVMWFSPTDLTKHHSFVLLDSEKKISVLGLQKSSAKLVPPKTILMTSRASIGYFGLINQPASTNQGFINIIPNKEFFRAYMLFDLKSRKDEIIGNANGSTFLEISKGKFRQMKIKLPVNESILKDFENEFEVTFNFIENLLKQNTKLREARDILLPRLMSGEMVV